MKQEVRLKLDVSLTIDAKHSRDEVRNILRRGIRCMFINNDKVYNSASFAEEADIYGSSADGGVKWEGFKVKV
jgi:hypothetical protein